MKTRFSDGQIIRILREPEARISAQKLCRKHAISGAIFYTRRKKSDGLEVPEVKRLRSPEESGDYTASASLPGCTEPDMVDRFCHGCTYQRPADQMPDTSR